MTLSAVDRVAGRTSPFPSSKSGALSPLPSVSLTEEHVAEAVQQSPDNGATLDFTHKSLTDVGEDSVERLATTGHNEALCSITRHVSTSLDAFELLVNVQLSRVQNCPGIQPTGNLANCLRTLVEPQISQPEEQQFLCLS